MALQSPIQTYNTLLSTSSFVFLVYFRGHWCPFCMSYLTQLQTLQNSVSAAGGSLLAVTSEPEEHLAATRKASKFQGKILVDTENELAKYLKKQGTLDVAISEKKAYAKGMAQPAILVVKGGKGGEEVLEKWAIAPSLMNMGGAKDRPDLVQVWENVQAKLDGQKPVHANYSMTSFFGVMTKKMFG